MKYIPILTLILLVLCACQSDDEMSRDLKDLAPCGDDVVINKAQFDNALSATILAVSLEDDCLTINYGASGCDASSIVATLIDAGDIAESLPPQRFMKLGIETGACLAYFEKEITINIRDLQVETSSVILHLDGHDTEILYTY